MRRLLDGLYIAAGYAAALFMISILIMTLLQVGGGLFQFYFRGTDAYAGYSMAASSFLALAYTLRHGEHIRVTLVIDRLRGAARRRLELFGLGLATVLAGYFAFFAWKMVVWSWRFNDVSMADDGTPLWLPQIGMALGGTLLAIAFLDLLVGTLRGRPPEPLGTRSAPVHSE